MIDKIEEILNSKEDFVHGLGASLEQIQDAERVLNLKFSKDYYDYLTKYGQVTYEGHELTGIGFVERQNVVSCTLKSRKKDIPNHYYVLEETGIDSITIYQDADGLIYQANASNEFKLIAKSLIEYIEKY